MSTTSGATLPRPEERRVPVMLLGFLALSLLAHTATFFLFQVTSPPHVTIPPPQTQVFLLTGDQPEQAALLRWIESEDPALVAASAHPVPPQLFASPYQPSYTLQRTAPRSMPLPPEPPVVAPGPELEALLRSVAPASSAAPPLARSRTRLQVSSPLQNRAPSLAAPPVQGYSGQPLEEATVLLGVEAGGTVRYTVLQKSSGDPRADAAVLAALARLRFAADSGTTTELVWGLSSLTWGDDAYAAPPRVP